MSWIQKLYETYNNCQTMVGIESTENEVPLLPICHTTQKAQVEIIIDGSGNFKRANVITKEDARTIIPCTEESGGRARGEAPHPLCDKLQYITSDFTKYSGNKTSYYSSYVKNLEKWCESKYSDQKLSAVLNYVKKGNIIKDLVEQQIFFVGVDGKLITKWEKKNGIEPPQIFGVFTSQEEAFIRWIVENPGTLESKVWRDEVLWKKWIDYYISQKKEKGLCFVSGKEELIAKQHLAKIRNDGDKAKIISSNDTSGFTFRGRFYTAKQAASTSVETSQKAHLALRWLISRQGYKKGDLAIVAWAVSGAQVPQPTDDSFAFFDFLEFPDEKNLSISTAQNLAIKLKKKIAGYAVELGDTADVVVMGVDSATLGRLSIIYYCELKGSEFIQRIDDWHTTCAWLHKYQFVKFKDEISGKIKNKYIPFYGAPAPNDIAEAAYGLRVDDRLRQATILRILSCIIEGRQIPRDLVESSVRRACNRLGKENWEWEKILSIACALFRKYYRKENYEMVLDSDRKTRDYLYGRLLALAESLEEWALNTAGENRETNAARLMQRFSEHPYTTWRTLEVALAPYKARLGGKSKKRQQIIDDVIASFHFEDFMNDKRLTGEFLLGYHCQRQDLRSGEKDKSKEIDDIQEN